METFETKNNSEKISASYTFNSIAKHYRNGKFYLINSQDEDDVTIIDNKDLLKATFVKTAAQNNRVLLIRAQFIVSKDVLDNKEQIMKNTTLDYSLSDEVATKSYTAQFGNGTSEYMDQTKYTFVVTKKIEIKIV